MRLIMLKNMSCWFGNHAVVIILVVVAGGKVASVRFQVLHSVHCTETCERYLFDVYVLTDTLLLWAG